MSPVHVGLLMFSDNPNRAQVISQRGFGFLQKRNNPKRMSELGSRLRGNDVVGWQRMRT
jgi:hypothetical protein